MKQTQPLLAIIASLIPAVMAGIAVINREDGYEARPPGAYIPARDTGRKT